MSVTYPGVYIEEVNSLSLSASASSAAVPIFSVNQLNTFFTETTRISSWIDYESKKAGAADPEAVRFPF